MYQAVNMARQRAGGEFIISGAMAIHARLVLGPCSFLSSSHGAHIQTPEGIGQDLPREMLIYVYVCLWRAWVKLVFILPAALSGVMI
jgi:hypothetical protein